MMTTFTRLMKLGAIVAATIIGSTSASAATATITWATPGDITGDSNVVTNGTLVEAYSLGYSGSGSSTVNGVAFEDSLGAAAGFTGSLVSNYSPFYVGSSSPFGSLSAGYQAILNGATYNPLTAPLTLTLTSLTVNNTYEFEWWVDDSRGSGPANQLTTATAGNSVTLADNNAPNASGYTAGGVGQYDVGTFTANASTEVITFTPGGTVATVNAFELRDLTEVPEPSTLFLLLAGLAVPLGMVLKNRKVCSN